MSDDEPASPGEDSGSVDAPGQNVDADALREDIDAIKSAMGLEERYPGQARMWLVYGAAIAVLAVLTNVTVAGMAALESSGSLSVDVPGIVTAAAWFGVVVIVVAAQWRLVSRSYAPAVPSVDWRQLFGAMLVVLLVLWFAMGELVSAETDAEVQGAFFLSHILLVLGAAFLLVGIVLGAEGIRLRDRLPFYVGGGWILMLAALLPHVQFLHYTGLATFGVLFAIHSAAAYVVTREE